MNRATAVYIIMGVVAIAGMWVILALGGTLTAPPDLAGQWELLPPGEKISVVEKMGASSVDPMAAGKRPMMAVEQSGEFFQVTFDDGPRLNLRLQPAKEGGNQPGARNQQAMVLSGSSSRMTVSGMLGTDVVAVSLTGARQGQWTAHRVMHTFAGGPGGMGSGTAGAGERAVSGTRE